MNQPYRYLDATDAAQTFGISFSTHGMTIRCLHCAWQAAHRGTDYEAGADVLQKALDGHRSEQHRERLQ